jgi:carboxypeptidase Taq
MEMDVENHERLFENGTILELNEKYKPVWALWSSSALLEWDVEVNMPEKASVSRGVTVSQVALLKQQQWKALYGDLEAAEKLDGLNDYEKGILRTLNRQKKYYAKIPPRLLEEIQRTSVESTVVWRRARKQSDFKLFQPYLQKILDLKLQEAEKLEYEKHPYNALLDLFEEGLTVEDMDGLFSDLIPALKRIMEKVRSGTSFLSSHPLEEVEYKTESMAAADRKIVELLNMPKDRFRMDTSTHPFMTNMSRDDVRITTRFEGKDFSRSMYSVIHESGHAIYELQLRQAMEYTSIGTSASTGFHESQSRFWENVIGRSRAFVSLIRPILAENLEFVRKYDESDLYKYFNLVRPGMIRVDADELTYNFHIALRYDLEKKLLQGKLSVSELPEVWNDTMQDYLGITPTNDSEGLLQDVHWGGGGWGYFPTYSLGNIIAGMIWDKIRRSVDLEETVRAGNFAPIKNWLYENIHKYGAMYPPKDLAKRTFGESFNTAKLIEYLETKYLS